MTPSDYLVQYGRAAFVGRFAACNSQPLARGERVVIRTPRGVEVGTMLCPAEPRYTSNFTIDGELLRPATGDDLATVEQLLDIGNAILTDADELAVAMGLPLAFLDAEVLLENGPVVLHVAAWDECDADPLFAELSRKHGRSVRMHDVARVPVASEKSPGCGKPGCGTESGGGCSTGGCASGSCSSGAVKSADELTTYFAGLRQQMELQSSRTALN